MAIFTCDHCKKQFKRKPKDVKGNKNIFCSKACYMAYHDVYLNCVNCYSEFKIKKKEYNKRLKRNGGDDRFFCSRACSAQYLGELKRKPPQYSKCQHCDKTFVVKYPNQKFCSQKCNFSNLGKMATASKKGLYLRCEQCGEEYYCKKHMIEDSRFCNRNCFMQFKSENKLPIEIQRKKFSEYQSRRYHRIKATEKFKVQQRQWNYNYRYGDKVLAEIAMMAADIVEKTKEKKNEERNRIERKIRRYS